MRILDLADRVTIQRNSQRSDELGVLLRAVLAAANPDGVFQDNVRPMFRGYERVERRRTIKKLSVALGIPREQMKAYLLAAGIVNAMD